MKKILSLIFLNYLRLFAKLQLAKIGLVQKIKGKKLIIVGITGSAGKTSTLLATQATLTPNFKVKTNSSGNSESGIPLSILDIKINGFSPKDWLIVALLAPIKLIANWKTYDIFLVEMGIDGPIPPQNMSYLLKIIKPTIGIFLNVGSVHSMQFDNTISKDIKGNQRLKNVTENIGREKAKLINSLPLTGFAILNLDDSIVSQTTHFSPAHKLTIGHSSGEPTFKIIKTQTGPNGFSLSFSYQRKRYQLNLPKFVLPQIYSVSIAAALLTAASLKINIDTAIQNLTQNLHVPHGRSSLFEGINNSKIIDSSYNSSPLACIEMLDLLKNFPSPRIAILGDMRELGLESPQAHKTIYQKAQNSADLIISVGPETQKYFTHPKLSAKEGLPSTLFFQYWWQALKFIKSHPEFVKGSTMLVKGSQNTIFLEELIKPLLKNQSDIKHLCRQSPYWLQVKHNFKNSIK
ncbi:MAG: Mur ligase family protein [Candidatus Shapirobacteria bacterium]|nr:Mur ligase family protein [Candidatus Shapirobacteria bacterium]